MTNKLTTKSQKFIQWVVDVSSLFSFASPAVTFVSETFSFQDRQCHLELTRHVEGTSKSKLYFKSSGELRTSATVTVRVSSNCTDLGTPSTTSITTERQNIWSYSQALSYDLLNIEVTIEYRSTEDDHSKENIPTGISSCLESLSMDFSKLLDGGMHPDLELRCDGQSLPAHKAILSARSAVFEAMLQSDMLERRTGSIEIVDMEFDVLREFLRYLYTSTLHEQSVETAMRLYEASDKYAVEGLKKKCGDFLLESLTQDNVFEILALADAHSDIQLKDRIIYYILDRDTPLSCKQWPRFCDSNPKLANEILYRAYKTKCSPK